MQTSNSIAPGMVEQRLVRYSDLKPCRNAFVDTRTPGSDAKENFTIVGPGVSENPDQHVHIPEPHGFNIGGARQPPGCLNSQHSHLTAEVFIVHTGEWVFRYGANADEGEVHLSPGDTISIPPFMFRGFENVGDGVGFLFAVLGGDDPGRVTWTPNVFELASQYGLVLLAGGRLIDTTVGEVVPEGAVLEQPPTAAQIAELATPEASHLARCVARASSLPPPNVARFKEPGVAEALVIVDLDEQQALAQTNEQASLSMNEAVSDGSIRGWWKHGFGVRRLILDAQASVQFHVSDAPEVLFLHEGELRLKLAECTLELQAGDTFSLPKSVPRSFSNPGPSGCVFFLVQGAG